MIGSIVCSIDYPVSQTDPIGECRSRRFLLRVRHLGLSMEAPTLSHTFM